MKKPSDFIKDVVSFIRYQGKTQMETIEVTIFITATGAKVPDGRQGQGQAEWSGGWVQGQDRQGSKTRRTRKERLGKSRS